MKRFLYGFSLVIVMALFSNVQPLLSEITSSGKDFWFTFLPNYHNNKWSLDNLKYADSLYVFIGSSKATHGTIEYYNKYGSKFIDTFSITDPSVIYTFKVCYYDFELIGLNDSKMEPSGTDMMNEKITKLSFHIIADDDVYVYGLNKALMSSDAFLALPTNSLGKEYYVMSYNSDFNYDPYSDVVEAFYESRTPSEFAVVATEDNTVVTIKPSDVTYTSKTSDQQVVTMNKGDVYLVQANVEITMDYRADLTGSYVSADKPIAVFAGHQRVTIPYDYEYYNRSRDYLIEQMIPLSAWGMSAFIVPIIATPGDNGQGYDIYRILSGYDATTITINGTETITLNKGEYSERMLNNAVQITADKPFLAAVFKKTSLEIGDPFMLLIPPKEQFCSSYRIIHPNCKDISTGSGFYSKQYIIAVLPKDIKDSLYINNIRQTTTVNSSDIPNSNYWCGTYQITEGIHTLRASKPFGVYVLGYGYADSYGYIGGLSLNALLNSGPVVKAEIDCFKAKAYAYRSLTINPAVDTVKFISDSSSNINYSLLSLSADSAYFNIELVNTVFDGKACINAIDENGVTTYENIEIPGLTISTEANFNPILKEYLLVGLDAEITIDLYNYGKFPQNIISAIAEFPNYFQSNLEAQVLNPGQHISFKVKLIDNPQSSLFSKLKIKTDCGERDIAILNYVSGTCDYREFNYPDFMNTSKYVLVHNANLQDSMIYITQATNYKEGAIWHKERVPVREGFNTEFTFKTSKGDNHDALDNSLSGADGIAFVIQYDSPYAIGSAAKGIGYEYIKNAIAIEFDLFNNGDNQILNIGDPNGNHIALMVPVDTVLKSSHVTNQFALINNPIVFLPDIEYHVSISYNREEKKIVIEIQQGDEEQIHQYEINNFDICEHINLEKDYFAWVGFTSATGNAMQEHILVDWHFCPKWSAASGVNSENIHSYNVSQDEYSYTLEINNSGIYDVKLYDIKGNVIENVFSGEISTNTAFQISKKNLSSGVYYLLINSRNTSKTYKLNLIK